MTNEARELLAQERFAKVSKTMVQKGESYSGNEDVLSNFRRNAERLGLSKYQIWAVYFNKHIDSINNAILNNPNNPVDKSECLLSRITDVIAYAIILESLLEEDK